MGGELVWKWKELNGVLNTEKKNQLPISKHLEGIVEGLFCRQEVLEKKTTHSLEKKRVEGGNEKENRRGEYIPIVRMGGCLG